MDYTMNNQGSQHGQTIPGQDSRVWNGTFQTPQDLPQGGDERQAQNAHSQAPFAPYTSYTNNTTNSSRGTHMTNPTQGFDDSNAMFHAPPYAHDLSVYELQRYTDTESDMHMQELPDAYDEIQATDTLLIDPIFPGASSSRANGPYASPPQNTAPTPNKSKISDEWKPHACIVKSCAHRGKPFARKQDYMRHIAASNDSAHARLRAAISR